MEDFRDNARRILKVFRAEKDLTQAQFASLSGISRRSVVDIERRHPVSDHILSRALDCAGYTLIVKRIIEKHEEGGLI